MHHDPAGPHDHPDDPATGAVDHATPGVDAVLGREVAMVVLPPVAGDELALRTERVRRLAGLHHPNLVDLYDVDGLVPDTESTLVLQNVAGRGLDELTGPWHVEALARVAAQVTAGLAHAHTHEVLHGVIGPASVVVDAGLQAWLTGFTASLRPDLLRAAPGRDEATRELDVASLGRTLRDALGEPDPPAPGLTTTLDAMIDGAVGARDAAERLTRTAEGLAAGEEETGLIAMPTRYFRAPGGVSSERPTDAVAPVAPPAPPPVPGATPEPASGPVTGPADPSPRPATGPVAPMSPVPPVPPVPLTAAAADDGSDPGWLPPPVMADATRAGRRTRRRAHARRAALLGGAAVSAALASAVALWATEGASGPQDARSVPSPPVPTMPAVDTGSPATPGEQDVDTTERSRTPDRSSRATPAPPSVLPPGPPAQLPPPVAPPLPLPPTRTSSTPPSTRTTPPSTTSRPPPTSTPPSSPTTGPSSPPTTRTTRPGTPRSEPGSRSSGPVSRSPAALAAGR